MAIDIEKVMANVKSVEVIGDWSDYEPDPNDPGKEIRHPTDDDLGNKVKITHTDGTVQEHDMNSNGKLIRGKGAYHVKQP